jgi:hypothetical protein
MVGGTDLLVMMTKNLKGSGLTILGMTLGSAMRRVWIEGYHKICKCN